MRAVWPEYDIWKDWKSGYWYAESTVEGKAISVGAHTRWGARRQIRQGADAIENDKGKKRRERADV